jgi:hypothetical protein
MSTTGLAVFVVAFAVLAWAAWGLFAAAVEEARRPNPLNDEDRKLQAEYRDKALTVLGQSHANGNMDCYTTNNDADLNSIRDDPRFQKILELEKKKDASAKKGPPP